MRRTIASTAPLLAACLLLALAGCGGDDEENVITPNSARLEVSEVLDDPAIFLQKNPTDTSDADDLVVVDVMLRSTAGADFSSITMQVAFDKGVVQVGQVDMSDTPLGDCTSSASCAPLCLENASTLDADSANKTGMLFLGVTAQGLCTTASVNGERKLMTIAFIGASTGTSPLTLVVDDTQHGDCEILDANHVSLSIPCNSGGAQVIVTR